jgi:ubiquinone/menaquinone biosynthesis C-methylase UbiE
VVEFGCGYGTFTIPAAQGITGTITAIDIEPEMCASTQRKAVDAGLNNVVALRRDFVSEGTGLSDASIGYAMLFNILHIDDPLNLLREAVRVLKPGGKVGIIHWRRDIPTPRGPSLEVRPTADQCRAWAESAGLVWVRDESLCCCSWHWGMVMQKPNID